MSTEIKTPAPGDIALCCQHISTNPPPEGSHWWRVNAIFRSIANPIDQEAKWLVSCGPCFKKANGRAEAIKVTADFVVEAPIQIMRPS